MTTFEDNKANIENYLQNLIIPLANEQLNQLTLQDLINLIIGDSGSIIPPIDDATGEVICHSSEEATTSELLPTVDEETSSSVDTTTLTDEWTSVTSDEGYESTTIQDPDDESNSSNFLFNNFQVMVLTLASIICLEIS